MGRYQTRTSTTTSGAPTQNKYLDSSNTLNGVALLAPAFSSSPTGDGVTQWATVTITAAQVKAIRATPITLVAAQGATKVIEFVSAVLFLDYGGTNVFTESTNNLQIKYTDGSGAGLSEVIETTGFIDQSADTVTFASPLQGAATLDNPIVATASAANKALVLHNTSGAEIAGNAGADNALVVKTAYRVWTKP